MKFLKIIFSLTTLFVLVSCQNLNSQKLEDGLYANIKTDKGDILVKLEYEKAPVTVANFVSLAEGTNKNVDEQFSGKKYYDGIKFHRVVPNFVIQAGDPTGNGSGGPGYKFEDEIAKDDEGKPLLTHFKKGTLSMANAGPDTNGSQFFITHKETPHLDGRHAVFGYVVKGEEVIDSIAQGDVINTIDIMRKGRAAKKFDAPKIIDDALKSFEEKLAKEAEEREKVLEKLPAIVAEKAQFFNDKKATAKSYPSGLKMFVLEKGSGVQPESTDKIKVNYAGYFTDGKMFDTSWKDQAKTFAIYNTQKDSQNGYQPFEAPYNNEARLISGFREGLLKMNYGERALLFIPSHLGYGEMGAGNIIPPNADLVFEVEIVDPNL